MDNAAADPMLKELGFVVLKKGYEDQIVFDRTRVDLKMTVLKINPENKDILNTVRDLDKGIGTTNPSQDEHIIVQDLLGLLKNQPELLLQVLKGGHVRLDDNGDLYTKWRGLSAARERVSSHPSLPGSKQYGVMGPWVHEILFGIVQEEGRVKTFFQLENTPWAPGVGNRMGHTADAIQYFVSRKNVGPDGSSIHTDKAPIRISTSDKSEQGKGRLKESG